MIRVGHVVVAGEIGGAEHMLKMLARSTRDIEHVAFVFSPDTSLPRFLAEGGLRVRDGGRIRESPVAFLRRSLGPGDVRWLAGAFVDERVAIAHLHTFGSQVLGTRAAARARIPTVRTEHSTRVYDDPSCWPFSKWSLERARAVVAISAHVRDVALTKAPWIADRIHLVHNGVDVERFAPTHERTHDTFTFVCVGRLEPRKGIDVALRALTRVPEARLDIVGDGEARTALHTLARELGLAERVTFHGYLADPRPVLARAHAALASSRKEGLGIAFLEGMATGLPLVAVPVGGLVEIVRDGETGVLAKGNDERALAEAMSVLVRDPPRAARYGEAARDDVCARFSLEAMARGYSTVYASLVK